MKRELASGIGSTFVLMLTKRWGLAPTRGFPSSSSSPISSSSSSSSSTKHAAAAHTATRVRLESSTCSSPAHSHLVAPSALRRTCYPARRFVSLLNQQWNKTSGRITSTSILLIVGPKCTLVASYVVPWWVTATMPTWQTNRRTDGRMPDRYNTLSARRSSVITALRTSTRLRDVEPGW